MGFWGILNMVGQIFQIYVAYSNQRKTLYLLV